MSIYRISTAVILIVLAVPVVADQAPPCATVEACRGLPAETAGPGLLRLLQDAKPDIRVEAAFALGELAYKPAVSALAQASADASDWQLAYAAVMSLERMQDPSVLPPLKEAAASYWYPPVRTAAECVVEWVERGKKCERRAEILDIDLRKLRSIRMNVNACGKRYPKLKETEDMKRYGNEEAMEEFKYTGDECALFGDVDPATGVKTCLARRLLYPGIAARVADGWLTGRDQGQSGELMFIPDSGKPYEVLKASVEDIYVLEGDVLALTGASGNAGMTYSLRKDGAGRWNAAPLLRLPAAPVSSYKINKREIIVNASDMLVIMDNQGNPRMAVCSRK